MQSECERSGKCKINECNLNDNNSSTLDKFTSNTTVKEIYDTIKKYPLEVKLLSDTAKLPTKGSNKAAGWDLYSAEEKIIPPNEKALISIDISISTPPDTYARVAPRSGLASKHFIDVGAGVIDEDYRGKVSVLLFNFSNKDFKVEIGDRIAQLILEKIYNTNLLQVEEHSFTYRGEGGFGSTGTK